jgi:hypothetical protein
MPARSIRKPPPIARREMDAARADETRRVLIFIVATYQAISILL